jgi:hypothetical protein
MSCYRYSAYGRPADTLRTRWRWIRGEVHAVNQEEARQRIALELHTYWVDTLMLRCIGDAEPQEDGGYLRSVREAEIRAINERNQRG